MNGARVPAYPGRRCQSERGIVLLAVLWMLALLGTAAALGLAEVRTGLGAAAHGAEAIRSRWQAQGCLATARAMLDRSISQGDDSLWYAPLRHRIEGCRLEATIPPDVPADLNVAPVDRLRALPGFDGRLADRVVEARRWGDRIGDFAGLTALAGPDQEAALRAVYPELRDSISYQPAAWVVTANESVSERWVRGHRAIAVVERLIR